VVDVTVLATVLMYDCVPVIWVEIEVVVRVVEIVLV
jgi:hypothetical protein